MNNKKGTQVNIPCICINDKDRPSEIPISKWITKDKEYTIIEFIIMNMQNRTIGVKLAEVNIDDCFPYICYSANRFGIVLDAYAEEANEAVKQLLEESLKEMEVLK